MPQCAIWWMYSCNIRAHWDHPIFQNSNLGNVSATFSTHRAKHVNPIIYIQWCKRKGTFVKLLETKQIFLFVWTVFFTCSLSLSLLISFFSMVVYLQACQWNSSTLRDAIRHLEYSWLTHKYLTQHIALPSGFVFPSWICTHIHKEMQTQVFCSSVFQKMTSASWWGVTCISRNNLIMFIPMSCHVISATCQPQNQDTVWFLTLLVTFFAFL